MIDRKIYIKKLRKLKDKDLIKVVMGVRRCGKSTLLKQFRSELTDSGISNEQIQSYNFELPENVDTWRNVYDKIVEKLVLDKMNYIFLDEVQVIDEFEKMVDGLYVRENVDLYITGSNAMLLSGELATLLSGRYISIELYPLSFEEYISAFPNNNNLIEMYDNYVNFSSFPQAVELAKSNTEQVNEYLEALYNSVITKDIMTRLDIRNRISLDKVTEFMFDSIGSEVSPGNIEKTLTTAGTPIVHQTVDNYIDALTKSYILYPIARQDIKGLNILKTNKKYYVPDIGIARAILKRGFNTDLGHILENVVYLELRRKGGRVTIGKTRDKEIDFVHIMIGGERVYYQVAYTAKEESTLRRELAPLKQVKDHYKKILLTTDWHETYVDGIHLVNVYKWLANGGEVKEDNEEKS